MKKYNIKKQPLQTIGLLMLLSIGLLTNCTKNFDELNTNPSGASNKDLSADAKLAAEPFRQIQQNIYKNTPEWKTQLQQNLIGDVYSGYMLPPTPFRGNVNNMNYSLVDGWNGFVSSIADEGVMAPAYEVNILLNADAEKYKLFIAWLKVLKVEAMHRVSDIHGPIVYSKYGKANADGSVTYDGQQEVYTIFFKELGEAIDAFVNAGNAPKNFSTDLSYDSDFTKWAKFANSLRLRLAMRCVKVDIEKAKFEAEKSLASSAGLIKNNDENYNINIGTITHPLNTISNDWNDIRMNACIDVYMNGFEDPRLPKYFKLPLKSSGSSRGIRQGIPIEAKGTYQDISSALVTLPSKIQLMTAAEVYFLLAEAKLRGWKLGGNEATIKDLYEKGISTSFEQYGVSVGTYLTSTKTPMAFVDLVTASNNEPSPSSISPAWNAAGTDENKLEQIITQKWIAMFPDGQEAWSEFRRTGYPKLFPLKDIWKKDGGSKIPTGEFIKRVNFSSNEKISNPTGYADAVKKLGGADDLATRLWWDVNKPNF